MQELDPRVKFGLLQLLRGMQRFYQSPPLRWLARGYVQDPLPQALEGAYNALERDEWQEAVHRLVLLVQDLLWALRTLDARRLSEAQFQVVADALLDAAESWLVTHDPGRGARRTVAVSTAAEGFTRLVLARLVEAGVLLPDRGSPPEPPRVEPPAEPGGGP